MFNLLIDKDFQSQMIALTVLNCAIISYQCWKRKQRYCKKIDQVEKAPIYEFEEFVNLREQKHPTREHAKEKSQFYLVKIKFQSQLFTHNQNIYSNQVYFCPPSLNLAYKEMLNDYQKNKDSFSIFFDSSAKYPSLIREVIPPKILAENIYAESSYQPEIKLQGGSDQHLIFRTALRLLSFVQKISESIAYFAQLVLEKIKFNKNYKRSNDQKRAPFFKGIFSGILYTHFSLLAGSNFLLKINLQDNQLSTELLADNKLQILNFYGNQIKKQNRRILLAITIAVAGISFLVHRYVPRLKLYWKIWTQNKQKPLSSQGLTFDKICQICYVNSRNVIFFKCRHLVVCQKCYFHLAQQKQHKCVICKEQLDFIKFIYPVEK